MRLNYPTPSALPTNRQLILRLHSQFRRNFHLHPRHSIHRPNRLPPISRRSSNSACFSAVSRRGQPRTLFECSSSHRPPPGRYSPPRRYILQHRSRRWWASDYTIIRIHRARVKGLPSHVIFSARNVAIHSWRFFHGATTDLSYLRGRCPG